MDQTPWFVPASIEHLERVIKPDWVGWEWGSGGSTVWLARRLSKLTSVEHDSEWHQAVLDRLSKFGLHNVNLILYPRGAGYYLEYADLILSMADDESLDIICVDGRARPRCVQNAIGKLKPGGILVVDNMERELDEKGKPYYSEGTDKIPKDWERHDYEGWWNGKWVTSLWFRP